uniref:Nucleolar protein 10 n=1 Tax=Castor canadensis TaxID=51338 RepID=A0A8C0XN79_CASCN
MVLFLQYYLHAGGDRVHELQKFDPTGQQTCSAHPTPFFAEDKDSGHCSTVKKPCRVPRPDKKEKLGASEDKEG